MDDEHPDNRLVDGMLNKARTKEWKPMPSDEIPDSAMEAADELVCGRIVWARIKIEEVARAMHAYAKAFAADAVREERELWQAHAYSDNIKCNRCKKIPLPNRHPFTVCDDCWDATSDERARGKETSNG